MSKHEWFVLPLSDLAERSTWHSLDGDRYAALRVFILATKSRGASRLGPGVAEHNVAPNDTIVVEQSHERIESHEQAITTSIQASVVSRVRHGLQRSVPGLRQPSQA